MNYRVVETPAGEALNAFDVANGVEPFRTIAERIALGYIVGKENHGSLVDQISHALEDAYNLGEKRGPFVRALRS